MKASSMGARLFERRTVSTGNLEILLWILYQLSHKESPTATQSVQIIDRSTCRIHHFGTQFSAGNLLDSHCFACRISPRSSAVFANPEKPEGEDEDVQMERRRTADAVAATDSEEVEPWNLASDA